MKILQICAAYKPAFIYGGPTMSVSMLSEQLAKAGVVVEVLATTANGKKELQVIPGKPCNIDGVKVIYFKRITGDHSHLSPALLKRTWNTARRFDVVHIHAWWNLVSVFSCLLALLRNAPVLLSPRGTLSPYSFTNKHIGPKWIIHHLLGKFLLHKCHIHATSQREAEAITRLFQPKSVTILPNFVKLPGVAVKAAIKPSPVFKLLFFSRIEEKKGLDMLLQALKLVAEPWELTIGGDGDKAYIESLKTIAVNNQIDDRIKWGGFYKENKFDLLRAHDLFVLPSYDENFGNAVIESLSVGTPVLISDQVGVADYVTKNNLGWVCQTNPVSISNSISSIIQDQKAALGHMRKNAPGIIFKDFNDSSLVQQYIQMYDQISKHG
ncbi:glycosyltransferase [soil metagenome]